MKQVDILAIGAHPDDVELAASGTLLRHIASGYSVGLLDLTLGELGTRGDATTRTAEAMASAKRMQAMFRHQLQLKDGFFVVDEANLLAVVRVIRSCRPTIVLANATADRHPDHGRAAELIQRACFLSGLRRIEVLDDQGTILEAWRPKAVYHYIQDHHLSPDFVVDISAFMEEKLELIRTFRSQFYDPNSTEPESPISSKDFLEFIVARAREFGRPAGYEYAEGWLVNRLPGVPDMVLLD